MEIKNITETSKNNRIFNVIFTDFGKKIIGLSYAIKLENSGIFETIFKKIDN